MNNRTTMTAMEKHAEKAILLLFACVLAAGVLFTPSVLFGQAANREQEKAIPIGTTRESITDQEIELMRQDIRAERRSIVAANLPLTTDESARFWPVYDQYIAETIKVNDTRYAITKEYITTYANMTDAQASNYIRKLSEVDKAMIDVRAKYLPTIEKVLSMRKAAMFVQIDRRVQLMIDLQLASQMPLISPKK